jgi:hypothetical protein
LAIDATGSERRLKIHRYTFILAPVFLDFSVFDTPLKEFETVAAKLAPKGINIEQAYQALTQADPADTRNVFSGASGTKRSWHRIFSPCFPVNAIN